MSPRKSLIAVVVAALFLPASALGQGFDTQREARNFSKIQERQIYETFTPEFQARLQQQNAQDNVDLATIKAGDPERDASGNICMQRKNECAGDVRFYDWADSGYGIRTPVLFTGRSGAVISGAVWRTRTGPAVKPAIVITTGSVQAPETLYWGIAAALAKRGYVVLTYDVQGQGRSDTYGEGADRNEGFPSQAGQPFYDGTQDAITFMLSTPSSPYAAVMEKSCSSNTSHAPKQLRREGEIDLITGVPHADAYNPMWEHVDPDRLGIAGHSLGAGAVSFIGQKDPRVKAIAAWDSLGTSTGGGSSCSARPSTRTGVPMTKPAIGFSNDYGLAQNPFFSNPTNTGKLGAFNAYRAAGVDSAMIVTRGGTHYEYSFIPGNTANQPLGNATLRGMHMATWYTAAWMDKYVKCPGAGDPVACEQQADADLLTNRWRNDAGSAAAEEGMGTTPGDPNMYSFYYLSQFDFTLEDGSEAICLDLRSGCTNMTPDGNPKYAGEYSYIDEANSPDGTAPAAPEFTDTDPDSPADDNNPRIKGDAPAGSTVRVYDNANCTGTPAAVGSAAEFASPGLQVTVADNSVTEFHGTATDADETVSACSASYIQYEELSCTQTGTSGPDVLVGTGGRDVLCGLGGADVLKGYGGDDVLLGGPGNDILVGGRGSDVLDGDTGRDTAAHNGGAGQATGPVDADLAAAEVADDGTGSSDTIKTDTAGTATVEDLRGSEFADALRGDAQRNRIDGEAGADSLTGRGDNDRLLGRSGSDTLSGGDGTDILYGDDGVDTLLGGDGPDRLFPGKGDDPTVDGGEGADQLRYNDITGGGITLDLVAGTVSGAAGNDEVAGASFARVLGTSGDDVLEAAFSTGPDVLTVLVGLAGNDVLNVGDGRGGDVINANAGQQSGDVDICFYDLGSGGDRRGSGCEVLQPVGG